MTCDCITNFDAKLAEHNTKIVCTFGFTRDMVEMFVMPKIEVEKIEPRKRVGPVIAAPTFCPFCGAKYRPDPAPSEGDPA